MSIIHVGKFQTGPQRTEQEAGSALQTPLVDPSEDSRPPGLKLLSQGVFFSSDDIHVLPSLFRKGHYVVRVNRELQLKAESCFIIGRSNYSFDIVNQ